MQPPSSPPFRPCDRPSRVGLRHETRQMTEGAGPGVVMAIARPVAVIRSRATAGRPYDWMGKSDMCQDKKNPWNTGGIAERRMSCLPVPHGKGNTRFEQAPGKGRGKKKPWGRGGLCQFQRGKHRAGCPCPMVNGFQRRRTPMKQPGSSSSSEPAAGSGSSSDDSDPLIGIPTA